MTILNSITRRGFATLFAAGITTAFLSTGTASAATPDEIKQSGTLRVGVLVDYPPFGGTDANQQPAGYDADVAALLAKSLGVKLELVPVTGPNRIPYLLTNKIDVLIATFGITAERAKQVLFSKPYSALTIYVLAPKSLKVKGPEDLKSVSIGVARASTQDTAITAMAPQGTEIKRFDDDATALQALISGQVQALGASNTILAQLTKDYPKMEIEPKITLKSQANGMAFSKSNTALQEYANTFIAEIEKNGELSKINERWFGAPLGELPPMPKL
ncbi:transporter substrate-binding domain-containing protein [Mesorhizobium sp. B292B1B]|uniref:transporter substrate-binding domain-containing protein n=1 Tax=unclassified Mesorhizobium TaxID=325217 RepID=UPI00112CF505|nr:MULTISPECIES: transporter substrate-binding domain-containing protein [unclassified Mesorhizobium]MCA0014691.1 transporter substrate-binding domain-containing protein [Mesorhizobium sp. B294B1A1]MCA0039335.1 transporter substrate-binding domain-containing protein [Mesorhizobium sp. B292B1B]TPM42927.1 transporter substrate-binding domain-containing protein [Mesorhizobium sp. B2-3-2]